MIKEYFTKQQLMSFDIQILKDWLVGITIWNEFSGFKALSDENLTGLPKATLCDIIYSHTFPLKGKYCKLSDKYYFDHIQ